MNLLQELVIIEASKQSALRVQQELIDALPDDFEVTLANNSHGYPSIWVERNGRRIHVQWPSNDLRFNVNRDYEVSGDPYETISSVHELVLMLKSELED